MLEYPYESAQVEQNNTDRFETLLKSAILIRDSSVQQVYVLTSCIHYKYDNKYGLEEKYVSIIETTFWHFQLWGVF